MSDLDTRLRALAEAVSAVAFQPTTDELLQRRRAAHRRRQLLPVGLVAAATAAVVSLTALYQWGGGGIHRPAGVEASCPGRTAVVDVRAPDARSFDSVTVEAIKRVHEVTGLQPCAVRDGNSVRVFTTTPDNGQLVPGLLGAAGIARVQSSMCPDGNAAVGYGNRSMPLADGTSCVLISTPEVTLDGHVNYAGATRTTDGSYDVTIGLDATASHQLAALVTSIADRRAAQPSTPDRLTITPDRLAIVMGDRVIGVVPIADATSGSLHLSGGLSEATSSMVVHLAGRSELPANTAFVPIVASDGVACAARNTAYVLSGGSTPATALADLVRARVSALTTDGCVSVAGDGTVLVRLGAAGRAIVTPRTFRSDLWVAPVTSDCHGKCRVPAGTPVFANADGGEFLVDEANKLDLNGHLTNATSGLLSQGADWLVTLELDSAAAQEFGTLTSRVVHAKEPGNQLAIIDHGVVLSAPVIQSAITDGTAQISGNLTQQDAAALAAQLSAPSVPADVTIETVPASSSS